MNLTADFTPTGPILPQSDGTDELDGTDEFNRADFTPSGADFTPSETHSFVEVRMTDLANRFPRFLLRRV